MEQLLSVNEAASYLQLHPITIYKLVNKSAIPFIRKKGLGIRFRDKDLDEWLDQGSIKTSSLFDSTMNSSNSVDALVTAPSFSRVSRQMS